MPIWVHPKYGLMEYHMDNSKVNNVQDTTKAAGPFSVITYDKDGNVCPVDVYPDGIAQDKEYSEEVN